MGEPTTPPADRRDQPSRRDLASTDERIERLARSQHGVIARRQVLELGGSPNLVRARLSARRWRITAPGVYEFPGTPRSHLQRVWIAYLHAGDEAVVSHRTAGRLHQLEPIDGDHVELIVGRNRTRGLAGTRRHRLDDLEPHHVTVTLGLRVTTPPRTVVDLAGALRRTRLAALVERAEVDRRCSIAEVATTLDEVRRSGKPGVQVLCDVLDELGPGRGLSRSELEKLLDPVIEMSGLPPPLREHPLPSTNGMEGFVDRFWPEAQLIVEADGRRWHTRRVDIARDHERDLEASRCGHHTLRLLWERLRSDPAGTASALADVYDQRLALLAG